MDDHRHRDDRRPASPGRDRAGVLFRKYLALLPGYPPDVASPTLWRPFGAAGTREALSLGGGNLQRIEATIVKLEREHFRGLATIVADPGDWLRRIRFLLGEFKRSVHAGIAPRVERLLEGDLLPARLAASLRRLRAGLGASRDLFDSLLFIECTGPGRPAADLVEWFDRHRDALERMPDPSGVADAGRILYLLRDDLPEGVTATLLAILAEPEAWRARGDHHTLRQSLLSLIGEEVDDSSSGSIAGEGPTIGAAVVGLPSRLLGLPAERRGAIGALLGLLLPDRSIECIRSAAAHQQRSAGILADRVRTLARLPAHRRGALKHDSRSELQGLVPREPGERVVEGVLRALDLLPDWSATPGQIDGMRRLLAWFPGEAAGARCGLLGRWIRLIEMDRRFVGHAARLSRLFERRGVHPSIAAAVAGVDESGRGDDPISELFAWSHCGPSGALLALFERSVYDAGWAPTEDLVGGMAALVDAFGGGDRAESIAHRLGRAKVAACDRTTLAPIARLTHAPDEVAALVAVAGDARSRAALETLADHLVDPEARGLAIRAGVGGEGALLRQWAESIRMAKAVGLDRPRDPRFGAGASPCPPCPPWATGYPAELHGVLARLAAASDDAERIAASVAGRLFVDREGLRREAAAIDAALAGPLPEETRARLLTRRDRLVARAEGREVSRPGTVAKVHAILVRRADEATVRREIAACRTLLRPRLEELAGVVGIDERVFDPPSGDLLAGILGLSGRVRRVGLRLLLQRACGVAFDALAEPANRGFVDRMVAKGIDVGPWLDGRVEIVAATGKGEEFVVRFADDVLDVLLMGHHFRTCLSPGAVNFFSAVTNAVDVNKRVAYGRTREGRIVGRRLLALTDEGLLETFAAYSHEGGTHFATATDAFARDLAGAMGTFLTTRGTVSPLVAPHWYDDGAERVAGERSFEGAEGLVSKTLDGGEPERVMEDVAALLGGRERLRELLATVLDLPSLRNRPELLASFADAFGGDGEVPVTTRLSMAMACRREGDRPRAARILAALPADAVVAALEAEICLECWAFHRVDVPLETVLPWLAGVRPALVSRVMHDIALRARRDWIWRRRRGQLDAELARHRAAAWRNADR